MEVDTHTVAHVSPPDALPHTERFQRYLPSRPRHMPLFPINEKNFPYFRAYLLHMEPDILNVLAVVTNGFKGTVEQPPAAWGLINGKHIAQDDRVFQIQDCPPLRTAYLELVKTLDAFHIEKYILTVSDDVRLERGLAPYAEVKAALEKGDDHLMFMYRVLLAWTDLFQRHVEGMLKVVEGMLSQHRFKDAMELLETVPVHTHACMENKLVYKETEGGHRASDDASTSQANITYTAFYRAMFNDTIFHHHHLLRASACEYLAKANETERASGAVLTESRSERQQVLFTTVAMEMLFFVLIWLRFFSRFMVPPETAMKVKSAMTNWFAKSVEHRHATQNGATECERCRQQANLTLNILDVMVLSILDIPNDNDKREYRVRADHTQPNSKGMNERLYEYQKVAKGKIIKREAKANDLVDVVASASEGALDASVLSSMQDLSLHDSEEK